MPVWNARFDRAIMFSCSFLETDQGTCALLSEKTHVYDVANRPWLLPYIADRATGGDRAFLLALIRHASADDPADRPSFAELVAAIDRRVEGATVN